MSKMREAFDEWFGQDGGSIGNPVRYQTFKAGYQAAIADVKAGGPTATYGWAANIPNSIGEVKLHSHSFPIGTKFYKLPEDV